MFPSSKSQEYFTKENAYIFVVSALNIQEKSTKLHFLLEKTFPYNSVSELAYSQYYLPSNYLQLSFLQEILFRHSCRIGLVSTVHIEYERLK